MEYIYLLIALGLSALQRTFSAKKNAAFYGKGVNKVKDERVKLWISNIHIITNQEYRAYWGSMFFYLMSFFMILDWSFLPSVIISAILTQLSSATASYHWQKWINLGSGLPEVDPNEKTSWELTLWGRSYWVPKFWVGKRRYWISIASGILIVIIVIFL
jgi:hypothetical protein